MSSSRLSPAHDRGACSPHQGARYVQWDTEVKGFGVRVSAGAKTFVLKYRLHTGRVRWKTHWPRGSDGAREGAAPRQGRYRHRGSRRGSAERQGRRSRRRHSGDGGGEVPGRVCARVRKKPSTQRLYRLAIESHITPRLGVIPIADVSHTDAVRLHERLRATPTLANRTIAVLSSLLAWSMTKRRYRPAGAEPLRRH